MLAEFNCGADLNLDGIIDPITETDVCTLLDNGDKICPIQAEVCLSQGRPACPQPGPMMIQPASDFPDGTLSDTRCIYNYQCSYNGSLQHCQLDVTAPLDGQCTGAYGWPFAITRPNMGVNYSNGTCIYTPEINGNPSTGEFIYVPLFECDQFTVFTDASGSYCSTCPSDLSKACGIIPSVDPINPVCSVNACIVDTTTLDPELIPPDISDYEPAENCTGVVRVFGGRNMRCRPDGVQTLFKNCCNAGSSITDSLGSAASLIGGAVGVSTVYKAVQAGYYAYNIANGTVSALAIEAYGLDSVVVEAARQGAVAAATAGEAASAAATNYLQSTLLNPTTIAIAATVFIITQLLGDGCDQEDITTATLKDSGYCHQTGTECLEEWWLIGCVQDVKLYCCFNSKLARIVHEQARPQLQSFQPNIWETCRGFTPDEFQMIDFSKIDLTEYIGELQTRSQPDIEERVTEGVQNYMNSIQQ